MDYHYKYNKELTHFSRMNRKNQTDVEKMLWRYLRNKLIAGWKFRRQYPVGTYIIDFYCVEKKLAVELDGSQHMEQTTYDERRKRYLENYGVTVLRFWDNEILQNIDGVLECIRNKLA